MNVQILKNNNGLERAIVTKGLKSFEVVRKPGLSDWHINNIKGPCCSAAVCVILNDLVDSNIRLIEEIKRA